MCGCVDSQRQIRIIPPRPPALPSFVTLVSCGRAHQDNGEDPHVDAISAPTSTGPPVFPRSQHRARHPRSSNAHGSGGSSVSISTLGHGARRNLACASAHFANYPAGQRPRLHGRPVLGPRRRPVGRHRDLRRPELAAHAAQHATLAAQPGLDVALTDHGNTECRRRH
jgi:hypothetical protein